MPVVVGCSDEVSWWLYLLRLAGITIKDAGLPMPGRRDRSGSGRGGGRRSSLSEAIRAAGQAARRGAGDRGVVNAARPATGTPTRMAVRPTHHNARQGLPRRSCGAGGRPGRPARLLTARGPGDRRRTPGPPAAMRSRRLTIISSILRIFAATIWHVSGTAAMNPRTVQMMHCLYCCTPKCDG